LNHEKYIQRCLQIAKNGFGTARPNPSVGAVIVYNDTIIGEGFTSPYGDNHAEVNAIASVKKKSLLKEATIYVTLEPCSHYGKTPPCADLIVKHQFKRAVIGCVDTNSLVAGRGIERLKNASIEVVVGILEEECRQHHRRFFTNQEQKRPYVVLKWAETKDGFIAPITKEKKEPVWISNSYSQQFVHKLRAKEQAILVGTNTVIADNPKLNLRSWSGQNPVRIVLDKMLRIPNHYSVYDGAVETIIICDEESLTRVEKNGELEKSNTISYLTIDFTQKVAQQICDILERLKIQSVIIEGGTQTLQTFIEENLWDEAYVFIGETVFKEGIKSPKFKGKLVEEKNIQKDVLKIFVND